MLRELQSSVGSWAYRNFGGQYCRSRSHPFFDQPLGSLAPLLGIGEEYGELLHASLKRFQGIRGYQDDAKYFAERDDAVADIMIYLCDYCAREGIDLQKVVEETWARVSNRDWTKNPVDADKKAG